MNKRSRTSKDAADKLVKGIRRKTRKQYSAEEKIRIVLAGLRGEESITAPTWALIVSACLVLVADAYLGRQVFASPWMAWTGLSSTVRPSLDFLPLEPWLAPFLMGMAFAKLVPMRGVFGTMQATRLVTAMTWPGRNSLAVYLCHRPVLLATIWVGTRII